MADDPLGLDENPEENGTDGGDDWSTALEDQDNGAPVSFDELGELHVRHRKGLPGPPCAASSDHDRTVREDLAGEPISEEQYHTAIEKKFRRCKCGGKYRLDAPPRCPACRSTEITEGKATVLYD